MIDKEQEMFHCRSSPCQEKGLTTNDGKSNANTLNKHFCSVFATEDINVIQRLFQDPVLTQ